MFHHRHRRLFVAATFLAVPIALCSLNSTAGQTPRRPPANPRATVVPSPAKNLAVAPELAAKLTASYQAAVDGKPLRELLRQIASVADFNLWIDRNVDPDQLVSLPGGQKTLFAALVEASQASGADVVAVGNMVLVGQRQKVQQLVGAILALPGESLDRSNAAGKTPVVRPEIVWPNATTPTEALRIVSAQTAVELPHDHWPEVTWRDISPQVATLLVTSQFDLMPLADGAVAGNTRPRKTLGQTRADQPATFPSQTATSVSTAVQLTRLTAPPLLTLQYPGGEHVEAIRAAASAADPRSSLTQPRDRNAAGTIELAGSPAAHVAAITAMLIHAAPARGQSRVDIDNVRFTLNLRGAPAHAVLAQLAAAAGRKLQVAQQAEAMVLRTITFDVQDQSLRQLVKTVTDQIGASPQWSDDTLTITSSP